MEIMEKDRKRKIKKRLRKIFSKQNVMKAIIIFATLALIATSILPYIIR